MGVEYYNPSSSNSNSGGILYRMRPISTPTQLYGMGGNKNVPVIRAGAGDKSFASAVNTGISLYTTSSTGTVTTTATITYTTYLASSDGIAFHLNSTDSCLYVLLRASTTYQLIKINDSTGAVTAIGSSFTPTTPSNWAAGGALEIDSGSGHLKYTSNGFTHLVNKTSGAIVSQNTAITIGAFLAQGVHYVTQDGSVGLTSLIASNTTVDLAYLPITVHSSYGIISDYAVPMDVWGGIRSGCNGAQPYTRVDNIILIDSDKVCIASLLAGNTFGAKIYLRSDFDKYVKSVSELGAGVI